MGGREILGLGSGVAPKRHLVTICQEVFRHGFAHETEPEEAEIRHK